MNYIIHEISFLKIKKKLQSKNIYELGGRRQKIFNPDIMVTI